MIKKRDVFFNLKKSISKESKIVKELLSFYKEFEKTKDKGEQKMIKEQINSLSNALKRTNKEIPKNIENIFVAKKLSELSRPQKIIPMPLKPVFKKTYQEIKPEKIELSELEKEDIKRFKRKEKKIIHKKIKRASNYIRIANKLFSGFSDFLLKKGYFKDLKRKLTKANMQFLSKSYISVIFLNTLISFFIALFLAGFFMFFNFSINFPFITLASQSFFKRFINLSWMILAIPIITYFSSYTYPSLERKYIEAKINQELPFATISMAAISESMIEPSNIFKIILSTEEYPTLKKEFTKLLNQINIFGYDFVTALRNSAFNSPSSKLSELFDGLATTITSGGDLSEFFDKRSKTLLFDYRLDRQRQTKSAETFMDIYISVVIAAPMILMLLLIMMRVSGLGISLSTSMISLIMVLGVSIINIIFLGFLQLKQRNQ
ncbi:hypothetical protein DRN73_06155 [Candidatus Pacearchaeota archaeon]|nr:MAG: hypothetical protein DRN73_06155 [Candidatus Pacearchaeota archaeon]